MKRLSAILALALVCFSAFAQTEISVEAPAVVAADEQFRLVFTVEGEKPSDFQWDCPSEFRLVWGPQTGSSTSISIVNGKTTRLSTSSYTYVLMPSKEGEFTIPAATAKVKGKRISSASKTIKVAKSGSSSASSAPSQRNSYDISSGDIFMRLVLDKKSVVVGESLNATLRLYQRVNVAGFEDVRFPSFNGFWSQVVEGPSNVEFHREALGDEVYNVADLRSFNLVPQQSGDLVIEPAELVCLINVRNRSASTGSIFDGFFQNDYSTVRKRVSTKETVVHVKALPQPQPESFCGGVGRFRIDAKLSTDSLRTHDAASLIIKVSGKGNLSLLQAPKVKFPADFEVYDVKTSEENGSRVFEYPFIPRHHGDFDLGNIEFSYYDISSGAYASVLSPSLPIHVEKTITAAASPSQQFIGASGKDVKNLGSDIRYIATGSAGLVKRGSLLLCSPLFFILLGLVVLGSLVTYLIVKKTAERRSDVVLARKKKASKLAIKRLSLAREYLDKNLYSAFYEELHKALLGFVADRMSLDAVSQDKETISARMLELGVSAEEASEFVSILDACELARYSPDSGNEAMKSHYDAAIRLISSIDSVMGKKTRGMKTLSVAALIFVMAGAPSSFAAAIGSSEAEELWNAGVLAYSEGRWEDANALWSEIYDGGYESARLWYNMGCASFKDSNLPYAVLYFERALKLDPSYADAKVNLEYTRAFLQDRIDTVPEFFVAGWVREVRNLSDSDTWAVLFLVFFALAAAMLLLYLLGSGKSRVVGFFSAIASLLIALCALGFSASLKANLEDRSGVIVTAPVTVVRSSPDSGSGTELFVLHEGTKLKVLDHVGNWSNVEMSDGRRGWVKETDFEII